ncbi:heavy-metal-associated domain-containing protein [Noviherbaspirillum galbum]|uniref:Heavy-metal-associated domain-containing protein n=1 Tax=Noviherbaspirillum galbum TaxID=2709383 RepID=A0A6B3SJS3_9BURK|nr:heavy-metal-associated domain-containing protein [Noviherbaspirillum galbum]NEX61061.1 heavy-metal-associated domain-containing protein [Noviherbaspirillum galbum]
MRSVLIQLADTLDQTSASTLANALSTVPGIGKVAISTAANNVQVEFDADVTSAQELRAVISRAGFGTTHHAAREGSCCGGCGGH